MAKYIYQEKGIEVDGKRLVHPKFTHIRKLNSKEFVAQASHGRRDKEIALAGDSRLKVSSTTPSSDCGSCRNTWSRRATSPSASMPG